MDSKPVYLQGRGRGRGRGNPNSLPPPEGPWGREIEKECTKPGINKHEAKTIGRNDTDFTERQESAEEKFKQVHSKHQEAVQRHLEDKNDYESSEEEYSLQDDDILGSVLKSFSATGSGASVGLGRTEEYLMNSVKSKANVCLICIETIKRNEAIWSCQCCYCMFHISCIQKWVKDGVYQQVADTDDNIDQSTLLWHCPKCRFDYKQTQCPTRYFCFCGKEQDPTFDPWLVPHSCGQTCGRKLKPECGHQCVLLCHPGPCPPCPQTVEVTCHCEQQPAQMKRCGAKDWSCGQPCGRPLSCDHHHCRNPCHAGECATCPEKSEQRCECGAESNIRPCASPSWQCQRVCGKALSCQNHTCERICHGEECGKCPRAGNRSCPCGKSSFELPCTEDIPTCMETCGKMLDCGIHECGEMCHMGPCGTCRQMVVKTCRCGQKKKELQCYKEYLCEVKCTKMKDCMKHQCKRKCCDGNCPTCEQQCNKMLGCRNHKCSSRCHRGRCYPCTVTVTLKCACGATSITVPCGREKVTKPPRCNKPCRLPAECHHLEQEPHRCHFGLCRPCRQMCGKSLANCGHTCPVMCHSAVRMAVKEKVQRAGPWDPKPEVRMEVLDRPCPACQVPVLVTCIGKHETTKVPCSIVRVSSCHRPCGRQLTCGNHTCELECHLVEGAADNKSAGGNCQTCEEVCLKPRPEGCTHECLLPCHPGTCPLCTQMIRMRCHCQMVVQHIECHQWTSADSKEQDRVKACPSRCPKLMACGHQCTVTCHPSVCPYPERCTEKVKLRCPCRRKKKKVPTATLR